jgi:hypothetical protein
MAPSLAMDRQWSRAFASQALSDLDLHSLLMQANAAKCHRLHFLQMAAEKVCKAFLIQANGFDSLKLTHTVIEKNLPLVLRRQLAKENYSSAVLKARLKQVRLLGREVELASPACDEAGARTDNSEYPWLMTAGTVQTPHLYSFPNIDDQSIDFIALTKLLRAAAEVYAA